MERSIQHFLEEGTVRLQNIFNNGYSNPKDLNYVITSVYEETDRVAKDLLKEYFESIDQDIFESPVRKHYYKSEGFSTRELITSRGEVTFRMRWYTGKEDNRSVALLEKILGLLKDERVTEEAQAKVLKACAGHSYRESGCLEEIDEEMISKQTVKNIVHGLSFPEEKAPAAKKEIEYLYIDADEDHISRQFNEKKGDLKVDSQGRKINTMIGKMVYIYEGIEREALDSKKGAQIRYRLKNPHYICGLYEGSSENERLWEEVYNYVDTHYDISKIRKIYLNADGGSWIDAGKWRFGKKLEEALDGFHLSKYLGKMTYHMMDSAEEARKQLRYKIADNNEAGFDELTQTLQGYCTDEGQKENIRKAADYIKNNWRAAMTRLHAKMLEDSKCVGSSTEAHVFHILSRRMSTLPMAWSRHGADMMCHLRAYYKNGGDMLELVRYSRSRAQLKKAAGAEEESLPQKIVLRDVLKGSTVTDPDRRYAELWQGSLSAAIKKKFWFSNHLWL